MILTLVLLLYMDKRLCTTFSASAVFQGVGCDGAGGAGTRIVAVRPESSADTIYNTSKYSFCFGIYQDPETRVQYCITP